MNEISEIKDYAQKNAVPIMKDEGIDFMCSFIKEHGFTRVLEIGSAIGYSAIKFASVSENVQVTTIEIDIDRYSKAVQNISDCGLTERIHIICGDALREKIEGQFDLIFIDAAKAQYIRFFEKFKNNLAEGGVIISDNLAFHGMVENQSLTHNYSTIKLLRKIKKYLCFLKSNFEFKTEFLDLGDGISISRKNPCPPEVHFEKLQKHDEININRMSALATAIVKEHFDSIIGSEQNDYMISLFQTPTAIDDQLYHGYQYYFVKDKDGNDAGFMAFVKKDEEMYLSKFYLKKEERGKNYSRPMLRFVVSEAERLRLHTISLRVNKNNSAVEAYKKLGFYIEKEDKADIGHGFVMDDYIMNFRI